MLKRGDRGEAVLKLQKNLEVLGFYKGLLDGDFGPKTAEAVLAYQTLYFADGIADDKTLSAIEAAVLAWGNLDFFRPFKTPNGLAEIENTFGRILFEESTDGAVLIKNDFAKNVSFDEYPVVGKQYFHVKLRESLLWVMKRVEARGLDREILQFGTWYPRHKLHNPKNSLSTHSWAIACDVNWATNPYGSKGTIDPKLVEIFKAAGFEWGGNWKIPDPMHFQWATGY